MQDDDDDRTRRPPASRPRLVNPPAAAASLSPRWSANPPDSRPQRTTTGPPSRARCEHARQQRRNETPAGVSSSSLRRRPLPPHSAYHHGPAVSRALRGRARETVTTKRALAVPPLPTSHQYQPSPAPAPKTPAPRPASRDISTIFATTPRPRRTLSTPGSRSGISMRVSRPPGGRGRAEPVLLAYKNWEGGRSPLSAHRHGPAISRALEAGVGDEVSESWSSSLHPPSRALRARARETSSSLPAATTFLHPRQITTGPPPRAHHGLVHERRRRRHETPAGVSSSLLSPPPSPSSALSKPKHHRPDVLRTASPCPQDGDDETRRLLASRRRHSTRRLPRHPQHDSTGLSSRAHRAPVRARRRRRNETPAGVSSSLLSLPPSHSSALSKPNHHRPAVLRTVSPCPQDVAFPTAAAAFRLPPPSANHLRPAVLRATSPCPRDGNDETRRQQVSRPRRFPTASARSCANAPRKPFSAHDHGRNISCAHAKRRGRNETPAGVSLSSLYTPRGAPPPRPRCLHTIRAHSHASTAR
ncbi:hypothetical protein PLICRDRAFT_179587 [Plicaturopsis crispa FD-325 SS-3]|uniref:Uncharacterized protein n=1 Tax=Plicaturopsis crispa FD-325 SS-3 TaxID=944288 RepID=A0A0C9SXF1_PLICR|nr:hypothetical protein PLICRDRAFT_179587 [Plicaturopsis crispa FD-325 SS-3]